MPKNHQYSAKLEWTGNTGQGTLNYRSYERSHTITLAGKAPILSSADPTFRGDPSRVNPEELLLSSLSGCHMLWYLHFCSVHKVMVTSYVDEPTGLMVEQDDGMGAFAEVTLHPTVTVSDASMVEKAQKLHEDANKFCFIANSCNFPIRHEAVIKVAGI